LDVIESKQAEYITFAKDLIKDPRNAEIAAWGFADPADIHTSPLWYITQLPLTRAIGNVVTALSRAKKLDSFKEMIEVLALPSPDTYTERASVRLIGAKAKLAKRFLAEFEAQVIQGRLVGNVSMNLGSSVLTQVGSDITDMIRSTDRTFGLYPPAPVVKPKMNFSSNINDYI
jgi:hypothetical protein